MIDREPSLSLLVRTAAPRSIFTALGLAANRIAATAIDSGAVEDESLTINAASTIERAIDLMARRDEIVVSELSALRNSGVSLILADIPFFSPATSPRRLASPRSASTTLLGTGSTNR